MTSRYREFDVAVAMPFWRVNGEWAVRAVVEDYLKARAPLESWSNYICPFCQTSLRFEKFEQRYERDTAQWHLNRVYAVGFCVTCGYWEFKGEEVGNYKLDIPIIAVASAVAAKYDISAPPQCAKEFAQFVRRHPEGWHTVAPHALERLVADIFRANHREAEVIHVGKPGDRGVDVLFIDNSRQRWLIQVKRRSKPGVKEGFSTLQSVLGTLALEGERHGMVVTTADAFSTYAEAESKRARQQGFTVELIDKGKLDRMLGPLLPRRQWLQALYLDVFVALDSEVSQYFYERLNHKDL